MLPSYAFGRHLVHRLGVAFLVTLSVVASLLVSLTPSADAQPRVGVVLSARFDGGEKVGVVAAAVSPKGVEGSTQTPPPTLPVIFTAGCLDSAPCQPGERTSATWDFGDGSGATTTELSVAHPYRDPGVYVARVKVRTATGVGTGEIQVLVSPRYADVDADLADKPGRTDREAVWAASALGLLSPCRTAFPALDPGDAQGTAVNRGVFCPEPAVRFDPSLTPAMPSSATANGLTGVDCLASWDACGLPVSAFADPAGGNPRASCGATCQATLKSSSPPKLDSSNRLVYDPLNCLDGYTATRSSGAWAITTGVEPGCVTRADFFRALVVAVDGPGAPSSRTSTTGLCSTESSVTFEMRRADALKIPVTHTRNGVEMCDPLMPITKAESYRALAKASGLPASNPSLLRDLQDATLGKGTLTPHPHAAELGAVLAKGGSLVGTTSCADGSGACFVPEEALTRSQLGVLFAGLFVGMETLSSGIQVGIVPSTNPTPVNSPVKLTVTVRTPASYSATENLTITWPEVSTGISTLSCAATTSVPVGASHVATATCDYTRSTAGTSALTVKVSDSAGNTSVASMPLVASDSAPRLASTDMTSTNEETAVQTTILASDAEASPLTYRVRSFVPGEEDPGTYPLTGKRATTGWGATAEVAVGKVTIVSSTNTSVTLELAPALDAYGSYSFGLQACDATACTIRPVSGAVSPVNDAPSPVSVTTVEGTGTLVVTLAGSDPKDVKREGYPAGGPIGLYRIESLPADGTLMYDSDPSSVTTYVAAAVGGTTNNPRLEWVPPLAGVSGDRSFTFSVQDVGHPGTLWSTTAGQVWLRYTA